MTKLREIAEKIETILASDVESLHAQVSSGGLSCDDSERLSRAMRTLAQVADYRRKEADHTATRSASVPTGEAIAALCADRSCRAQILNALVHHISVSELTKLIQGVRGVSADRVEGGREEVG